MRSQSHAISYLQTIPSVQKNEIFTSCCGLQGFLASPVTSSSQQLWNLPRLLLFICNKLFSTCCGAPAVYPQRDHIRLLWSLPRLFLLICNELSSSSCGLFQGIFLLPPPAIYAAGHIVCRPCSRHAQNKCHMLWVIYTI